MKKFVMLLALCCAFSLAAVAQYGSSSSGSTSSDQATTTKKSKAAAGEMSGKEHTVTGCLSGPNGEGLYTLTNGHYKKGLEVGGSDELKNHVGHEVKLTGTWASESDLGAKETKAETKESKSEAKEKHMKVSKIEHVSETCTSAKGASKKGKGSSSSSTPPSM